jgi:hypothetical protein
MMEEGGIEDPALSAPLPYPARKCARRSPLLRSSGSLVLHLPISSGSGLVAVNSFPRNQLNEAMRCWAISS